MDTSCMGEYGCFFELTNNTNNTDATNADTQNFIEKKDKAI